MRRLRSSGGGSRLGGAKPRVGGARLRRAEHQAEQAGEAGAIERQIACDFRLRVRRFAGDRLRQRDVRIDRVGRDEPPGQLAVDFRPRHVPAQARQRELVAAQGEVGRKIDRRGDAAGLGEAESGEQAGDVAGFQRRRPEQRRFASVGRRPEAAAPSEVGAGQRP